MNFRRVGTSGLRLTELGLGSWLSASSARTPDADAFRAIVETAISAGIRFFDTADVYVQGAAETALGAALVDLAPTSHVLATKCFFPGSTETLDRGLSRKHVTESAQRSRQRLGRETLDILFCHRFDPEVSLRELVLTMKDLTSACMIHYWGTSEWPLEAIAEAVEWAERLAAPPPVADQYELHVLNYQVRKDRSRRLAEMGLGAIAWSPLAGGLLTGKYRGGIPRDSRFGVYAKLRATLEESEALARASRFADLCNSQGVEPAHVALRLLLHDPQLSSVILGATRPSHVNLACSALEAPFDDAIFKAALDAVG